MKRNSCFLTPALLLSIGVITAPCLGAEPDSSGDGAHEGEANTGVIRLSPENLEHIVLKSAPVRLGNLGKALKVPGRVRTNANRTAVVSSTFEGRLQKLNYDINDEVRTGDVLALVETPELLGKSLQIKSPIDGVITDRKRSLGEMVGKETEIYTVSDPKNLWVIAEVRERDLALVRVGQDASFTVLPYPDRKFSGKILRIGSEVEMKSRTVEVRIGVANTEGLLKPGMFTDVQIITTVIENVPLISDVALQTDGTDQIVFVKHGAAEFERRVVTIGHENAGQVQILSGLKVDEEVVNEGSFILKSEMLKGELGEE